MTDYIPPEPLITEAQRKIRTTLVHDQLRKAGLRHALLCDSLFMRGVLVRDHWNALHLFRVDLLALDRGGRKKDTRNRLPDDARPRKDTGYVMVPFEILRVKRCPKVMDDAVYEVALILVGEAQGEVSDQEARVAGWQINELYTKEAATERWRDR
jgi:hypothetical protein